MEQVQPGITRAAACVVPVVATRSSPVAAGVVAFVLGLPAGLLAYATAALLFAQPGLRSPDTSFVVVSFVGGWAVAAAVLAWRATLVRVIRRALLLGAVQWLLLAPLVNRLQPHEASRVGDMLRVGLRGLPLRLPGGGQALLLATGCLVAAIIVAALPAVLGARPADAARD